MAIEWAIVMGCILFIAGMVIGALVIDDANKSKKKTSLLDLHKGHH